MKPAMGLTLLDYSDDFPATWAWLKIRELVGLGAIFDVQDGNHGELYPRTEDFGEIGVPYISAEHVINDRVQIASAPRLKQEKAKQVRVGFAKANDVILAHNATVGRVAILPFDSTGSTQGSHSGRAWRGHAPCGRHSSFIERRRQETK